MCLLTYRRVNAQDLEPQPYSSAYPGNIQTNIYGLLTAVATVEQTTVVSVPAHLLFHLLHAISHTRRAVAHICGSFSLDFNKTPETVNCLGLGTGACAH